MVSANTSVPCIVEDAHARSGDEVLRLLGVSPDKGLAESEARMRLEKCGPNVLEAGKKRGFLDVFVEQFKNLFVVMLLAATLFSLVVGETIDAILIFAIILFMAVMGSVQEYRAEKILETLKKLASPKAHVLRGGRIVVVDSSELVPGDIIVLSEGDRVPADARVIEDRDLYVDESMLTGESIPVRKQADVVLQRDVIESDRVNIVYSGTFVVRGSGKAVVVATGMNTYMGRIARIVAEAEEIKTPFQVELDRLAKRIAAIIVAIAAMSFIIGYVKHEAGLVDLILTSIALAVAAVPEGLPAIVVIVFSVAAWNMARRNALVRRLAAVEALGSASVIATDKTGTLTVNEMTVKRILAPEGRVYTVTGEGYSFKGGVFIGERRVTASENKWAHLVALVSLLNNNAEVSNGKIRGDPLEAALIVLAAKLGLDPATTRRRYRRLREISFSSERKRMTVIVDHDGKLLVLSKGAPEVIVERSVAYMDSNGVVVDLSDSMRQELLKKVEEEAGKGFRVIALAYREANREELEADDEAIESKLVLLGFASLIDPPRPEVPEAVRKALSAGIKVVMVTGDHPATARAIADMIGLPEGRVVTGWELERMSDEELAKIADEVTVFARVTPEHKARIVRVYRSLGHIVAVTGDGVNDAPALKLADIGVAMGIRGTDVAKEASDIILLDDNFATIVAAVEEGRRSFDNVKRTVLYLLSANIAEVAVIFYAALRGIGIIFTAPMLLWINLVTDGFPAAGLAFEEAESDVMKRPPRRRDEPILGKNQLIYLLVLGMFITFLVLATYHYYEPHYGHEASVAAAFLTMMSSELALSLSLRRLNTPLSPAMILKNKQWLLGYIAGLVLSIAAVTLLAPLFKIEPLAPRQIAVLIIIPHIAIMVFEEVRKRTALRI